MRHSSRRPKSLSGRKFVIYQDNLRKRPGANYRLTIHTRAAPASFQRAAQILSFPALSGSFACNPCEKQSISTAASCGGGLAVQAYGASASPAVGQKGTVMYATDKTPTP